MHLTKNVVQPPSMGNIYHADSASYCPPATVPSMTDHIMQLISTCQERECVETDLGSKLFQASLFTSGLHANEYTAFEEETGQTWSELKVLFERQLPSELLEQFSNMKSSCKLGIMNKTCYAWVAVDTNLFVWNYHCSGSDIAYYEEAEHVILRVEIAPVKMGVKLRGDASYLLCIVTLSKIILVGALFVHHENKEPVKNVKSGQFDSWEMQLSPKAHFVIPTDGVTMLDTYCCDNGRIFCAGDDGNLYEIHYKAGGILGPKAWKENISEGLMTYLLPKFIKSAFVSERLEQVVCDESRYLLYTRGVDDTITLYSMGETGDNFQYVCSVHRRDIQNSSSSAQIDASAIIPIVGICPLAICQSRSLCLEAVSHAGIRLYFTCYDDSDSDCSSPSTLRLVHIRFPPGWAGGTNFAKAEMVTSAYNVLGCSFFVEKNPDGDALWSFGRSLFHFIPDLIESVSRVKVKGRLWALKDVPFFPSERRDVYVGYLQPCLQYHQPSSNEYTSHQHSGSGRLLVLTSETLSLIEILSPRDIMLKVLSNYRHLSQEMQIFYKLHGPVRANALCVSLLCQPSLASHQIYQELVRLFILNSGQSLVQMAQPDGSFMVNAVSGQLSAVCRPFRSPNIGQVLFSSRHDAYFLHFSRLARLNWNMPMAISRKVNDANVIQSMVEYEDMVPIGFQIECFVTTLQAECDKMSRNKQSAFSSLEMRMVEGVTDHGTLEEALRLEAESLRGLLQLAKHYKEVINLWKLLIEHQFHVVVQHMSLIDQQNLLTTPLKSLLASSSSDVFVTLINSLISIYLGDGASVRIIADALRKNCPALFTNADAAAARAGEMLHQARQAMFSEDRQQLLAEALLLYESVVEEVNLKDVCDELMKFPCYDGIVRLVLSKVDKIDPQDVASSLDIGQATSNSTFENANVKRLYNERMSCYEYIINLLRHVISESVSNHPEADESQCVNAIKNIMKMIWKKPDKLMHYAVFEWFIEMGFEQELIKAGSAHLEQYIVDQLKFDNGRKSLLLKILATFYEFKREYAKAARVLLQQVEMDLPDVTLDERIEFCLRAKVCLQASNVDTLARYELMQKVSDLQDVLKLQKVLIKMLSRYVKESTAYGDVIEQLSCTLCTTTELFEGVAQRFQIPECKLIICVCSSFYQQRMIVQFWKDLIARELEMSFAFKPGERSQFFAAGLIEMARYFTDHPRYMPLGAIASNLLEIAYENDFFPVWLPETMESMGLDLFEVVECVEKERHTGLQEPSYQLYCINVIIATVHLLQTMKNNPLVGRLGLVENLKLCLRTVDHFGNETEARSLREKLHNVIYQLTRR